MRKFLLRTLMLTLLLASLFTITAFAEDAVVTGSADVESVFDCQNLHVGDLVAYDTAKNRVCTLEDLHAKQEEFPHCIADGILIRFKYV